MRRFLVVLVLLVACGGRDQLEVPFEDNRARAQGVGPSSGNGGFGPGSGGFGGDFGGFGGSGVGGGGGFGPASVVVSSSAISSTVVSSSSAVSSAVSSSSGMGGMGGGPTSSSVSSSSGGPLECFLCINNNCPEAQECFNDPDCIQGTICAASQCLGNGFDFECVIDCFDGDFDKAFTAVEAFICVTQQCGDACQGALPF